MTRNWIGSLILLCLLSTQACVLPDPIEEVQAVGFMPDSQESSRPVESEQSLDTIMAALGWANEPIALRVNKSERRMAVSVRDSVIKTYLIVLGLVPEGDKAFQGDRKTPEGTFTFRAKYPHASWHKFIWVDYPNEDSWQKFKTRKAEGAIPQNSKIGGEIGIHGVPDGMDDWIVEGSDWTYGCIAMRNKDLDEIYAHIIPKKSIITIVP